LTATFGRFAIASKLGQVDERVVVLLALQQSHVIDDDLELRMALRNAVDVRQRAGHRHHRGKREPLRDRPEPVRGPIRQPRALRRGAKGEAQAEHAGLTLPSVEDRAILGMLDREPAHHREAIGVTARGVDRQLVAIALPRRRHDDHARDARGVHLLQ
jgi:hypothetical protein